MKKIRHIIFLIILMLSFQTIQTLHAQSRKIPHLKQQGTAAQLVVDGWPMLILGGELGNSSASSLEYMEPIWPKLVKMHVNTALVPVYWELVEPAEGQFDFALVDSLIFQARRHELRLVFLWFASWKNSMSCYTPLWVKSDQVRFPRAKNASGKSMEMLSCFSGENLKADARAFTALMHHIKEVDSGHRTVVMIQVENEIGMIPDARDHNAEADRLFQQPVSSELINYLDKNRDRLIPEFFDMWKKTGFRKNGSWEQVFGKGLHSEEIFMAWYYARYVNVVASAGKSEYPLPMYVNAALIRPDYQPGQYPSAGPLPHIMDVWRAGAPSIDFLSPDIYFPNFEEWCIKYQRSGNPLFIPEAAGGRLAAVNVLYAIGNHDAIGFCPFSIESTNDPENNPLTQSYDIMSQLSPLILQNQGKGRMAGVLVDGENQEKRIKLGDYTFVCTHEYTSKWTSRSIDEDPWPRMSCLIIQIGRDEFVIAGSGVIVTFEPAEEGAFIAGIGAIDEGRYVDGIWTPGRRMNGDQSHQGRHMRLSNWEFGIQRIILYRYQ